MVIVITRFAIYQTVFSVLVVMLSNKFTCFISIESPPCERVQQISAAAALTPLSLSPPSSFVAFLSSLPAQYVVNMFILFGTNIVR